jgi:nicotinamidase-related amidase
VPEGDAAGESSEQLLRRHRSALLVVDVQNDNCSENGALAKSGKSVAWARRIIPGIARLIDSAHDAGVPVIFSRNTYSPELGIDAPGRLRLLRRKSYLRGSDGEYKNPSYQVDGTWGHAILDELDVRPGDARFSKFRSSAFHGTPLDFVLRGNNVETLVIVGVVTEGCVESTARDAESYGYFPVIVADAVATSDDELHAAAMTILRARCDVVDARLLAEVWGRG